MRIKYEVDPCLSLKDKGVLAVAMALMEEGIHPTITNIKDRATDSDRAVMTSLKNLTEYGYYSATKFKVPDGPGFDWKFFTQDYREE